MLGEVIRRRVSGRIDGAQCLLLLLHASERRAASGQLLPLEDTVNLCRSLLFGGNRSVHERVSTRFSLGTC